MKEPTTNSIVAKDVPWNAPGLDSSGRALFRRKLMRPNVSRAIPRHRLFRELEHAPLAFMQFTRLRVPETPSFWQHTWAGAEGQRSSASWMLPTAT